VQKMIKLRRMTEAGLERIAEAKITGSWYRLDNINEIRKVPRNLALALSADGEALKSFKTMTPTYKKQFLWWIESAKKEETRRTG